MTPDFASPAARSLAAELGIDAGMIVGTSKGGAISVADVRAAGPRDEFGRTGTRLWQEVTAQVDLRADEEAILVAACRTADQIATLEETVAASPPMIPGSKGQEVLHPAIPELRLQRQQLASLLAKLDVPEGDGLGGEWDGLSASSRARKAARARWGMAA